MSVTDGLLDQSPLSFWQPLDESLCVGGGPSSVTAEVSLGNVVFCYQTPPLPCDAAKSLLGGVVLQRVRASIHHVGKMRTAKLAFTTF